MINPCYHSNVPGGDSARAAGEKLLGFSPHYGRIGKIADQMAKKRQKAALKLLCGKIVPAGASNVRAMELALHTGGLSISSRGGF